MGRAVTVTTVYAGTGDGYIFAGGAVTYADARGGSGATSDTGATSVRVGQRLVIGQYILYEAFFPFDLSGIGGGEEASDVTLSLDGVANGSTTDDDFEVHEQAFGTLTAADWQSGDAYNAATPLATWNTSGYSAGYNAFTSDASFVTALDLTATFELIVISSRHVNNTAPTSQDYVDFATANAAGTTTDPKLAITHTTIASGLLPRMSLMGVG